jgi:CHAD domain-containing protein
MTGKEAEVRAGSATAVHEMRVAGRHLEVLLRVFRGHGPAWAISSRPRIHGLIKALGGVRDTDVQLAFLDSALTSLDAEPRAAFEPMRARLLEQQAKARSRLFSSLDSPSAQAWQQEWREHLRNEAADTQHSPPVITAVPARELVRDAFRKLRKRADRIGKKSPAEEYHEVRIRAKRLRYTLDAFAGLYGDAGESFGKALAKLQTVLGNFHDATVREQRFTALVADGARLPSSTSFAVGRLVERDAHAIERWRAKFAKAYRRVHGRRWRELSAVMKRVADEAVARSNPGDER